MSTKCKVDDDCSMFYICEKKKCVHTDIFSPEGNLGLEIFSYILIIVIVGISKVGGIGGGIVKVPIMQLMLNYETKQATYLIYPLLFATGITNAYLMMVQKHPYDNRPLIRYNVTMMMIPMLMVGSSIGIMINSTAPDLILTIILVSFLIAITPYLYKQYKNSGKKTEEEPTKKEIENNNNNNQLQNEQKIEGEVGHNQHQKQEQELQNKKIKKEEEEPYILDKMKNQEEDKNPKKENYDQIQNSEVRHVGKNLQQDDGIVENPNNNNNNQNNNIQGQQDKNINQLQQINIHLDNNIQKEIKDSSPTSNQNTIKDKLMKAHSSLFQWQKLLMICSIFLITQFFNFLKGGKALKSFANIKQCDNSYWSVFAINLVIMFILTAIIWIWIRRQIEEKEKVNFSWGKIDVRFTKKQLILFALIGFSAGLFTSATGLGSGLIMVPGLLYAGLDPRSAAAVSGFAITFLSFNTLILLLLEGYVDGISIAAYLVMGLLAGTVFAKITYYLMQKYKAHRLVILIVLVVDVLNILSAGAYLGLKIHTKGFDYVMKTHSICEKD